MSTRTDTSGTAAPTTCPDSICPDWVCPDMFRDHIRTLVCETGLSWRLVAAHADVSARVVRALLHGREHGRPLRQLHVNVARALAATSVESIQEAETTLVDAAGSRALLQALRRLGWTADRLRPYLKDQDSQLTRQATVCTAAAALRISACYDLLTSPRTGARGGHPAPGTIHVDSGQQQHPSLDRKTPPRWCPASRSGSTRPAAR